MNCKKCGYVLTNGNTTCPNCGEVYVNNNGVIEGTFTQTPVMQNFSQTQSKSNNKIYIIIIVILSLIILSLGIFIGIKFIGKSNTSKKPEINDNTNIEVTPTKNEENSKDSVEIQGFKFNIPAEFSKETKDDAVVIGNDKFVFSDKSIVIFNNYTIDQIINSKYVLANEIDAYVERPGEGAFVVNEYGGKKYLIITYFYYEEETKIYTMNAAVYTNIGNNTIRLYTKYNASYADTGFELLTKFIDSVEETSKSSVETNAKMYTGFTVPIDIDFIK